MAAETKAEAIGEISAIELGHYADRALRDGRLESEQVDFALREYRQFLLLIWVNKKSRGREFIVPTERADQIWHEHILDTAFYRAFCDRLVGRYIDHTPGLEKGTAPFVRAVDHTRAVHHEFGCDAFSDVYLGMECRDTNDEPQGENKSKGKWRSWIGGSLGDGSSCGGGCGGCGGA